MVSFDGKYQNLEKLYLTFCAVSEIIIFEVFYVEKVGQVLQLCCSISNINIYTNFATLPLPTRLSSTLQMAATLTADKII